MEIKNIGIDITNGEVPQVIIPKNRWFAAELINKKGFSLVGCTVAPGFDFNDFQLAKRSELIKLYPQHKNLITKFTRE